MYEFNPEVCPIDKIIPDSVQWCCKACFAGNFTSVWCCKACFLYVE